MSGSQKGLLPAADVAKEQLESLERGQQVTATGRAGFLLGLPRKGS